MPLPSKGLPERLEIGSSALPAGHSTRLLRGRLGGSSSGVGTNCDVDGSGIPARSDDLRARLAAFLPALAASNTALNMRIATEGAAAVFCEPVALEAPRQKPLAKHDVDTGKDDERAASAAEGARDDDDDDEREDVEAGAVSMDVLLLGGPDSADAVAAAFDDGDVEGGCLLPLESACTCAAVAASSASATSAASELPVAVVPAAAPCRVCSNALLMPQKAARPTIEELPSPR